MEIEQITTIELLNKFMIENNIGDLTKDKNVGDFLCNLMLFCKKYKIDFEEQFQYAKNHYFFE